ncbi:MAG: HEAT repeat domain-containing protein [Elusimicrobia bacterium]|nr:HEAT repeat domain-containing protein [Candidatus Liberimonas magnetica]
MKNIFGIFLILPAIINFYQFSIAEQFSADDYFDRGSQRYAQGDLDRAVLDLKKSMKLGKEESEVKDVLYEISTVYYTLSGEKYVNGDTEGAFADVDKSLELNKDDMFARNFLGIYAKELATKYLNMKNYDKAMPYLEKLLELFPEENEYKTMYETAKKHLSDNRDTFQEPASSEGPVQATHKQEKAKQQQQNASAKPDKKLFLLLESRMEKQEKLLEGYEEKYKEFMQKQEILLQNSEGKHKELMQKMLSRVARDRNEIADSISRETTRMKQVLIFAAVILLVLAIFSVVLVLFLARYIISRSALLRDGHRHIWGGTTAQGLPDFGKRRLSEHSQEIEELRIIEAEVVGRQTDPQAAEDVLQPFLQSKDSKINAEAARALFKHNPTRALNILEEMESSPDKQTRIDAIHALGEINSPEAVKVLLDNLNENEMDVKKELIRSLRKINELKKAEIPEYLQDKIEKALNGLKDNGNWVIE